MQALPMPRSPYILNIVLENYITSTYEKFLENYITSTYEKCFKAVQE